MNDATSFRIAQLRLDPENPRLPEGAAYSDEATLQAFIAREYNIIELGRSMAAQGYLSSEPVIAVSEDGNDGLTVVDGNRRLVAARLLWDPAAAVGLEEAGEWRELAARSRSLERIPVVIADGRDQVDAVIGYRHISGIEPWEPYQKGRFIARLVRRGRPLDDVADIVGERSTDVEAAYRNHAIVEQARQDGGFEFAAAGGLRARLAGRLLRAAVSLERAADDFAAYGHEPEMQDLIRECRRRIAELDALAGGSAQRSDARPPD